MKRVLTPILLVLAMQGTVNAQPSSESNKPVLTIGPLAPGYHVILLGHLSVMNANDALVPASSVGIRGSHVWKPFVSSLRFSIEVDTILGNQFDGPNGQHSYSRYQVNGALVFGDRNNIFGFRAGGGFESSSSRETIFLVALGFSYHRRIWRGVFFGAETLLQHRFGRGWESSTSIGIDIPSMFRNS